MKIHCCICKAEIDGSRDYGQSCCCDRECFNEMEWRRTLSIMGKPYVPQKGSRWDQNEPTLTPPFPRELKGAS